VDPHSRSHSHSHSHSHSRDGTPGSGPCLLSWHFPTSQTASYPPKRVPTSNTMNSTVCCCSISAVRARVVTTIAVTGAVVTSAAVTGVTSAASGFLCQRAQSAVTATVTEAGSVTVTAPVACLVSGPACCAQSCPPLEPCMGIRYTLGLPSACPAPASGECPPPGARATWQGATWRRPAWVCQVGTGCEAGGGQGGEALALAPLPLPLPGCASPCDL